MSEFATSLGNAQLIVIADHALKVALSLSRGNGRDSLVGTEHLLLAQLEWDSDAKVWLTGVGVTPEFVLSHIRVIAGVDTFADAATVSVTPLGAPAISAGLVSLTANLTLSAARSDDVQEMNWRLLRGILTYEAIGSHLIEVAAGRRRDELLRQFS